VDEHDDDRQDEEGHQTATATWPQPGKQPEKAVFGAFLPNGLAAVGPKPPKLAPGQKQGEPLFGTREP
jgi:hypothetical protein